MTAGHPRIISLCSGYGGLDRAVQAVFGGELAYWSDIEPGPVAVMSYHHPNVPNLGDIKLVDWSAFDPIDILTAGYPCQPFSNAGKRLGTDDPRHLWPYVAHAIGVLRPRLVVLENVAAHLRRGFDSVAGDLAEIGYDATWTAVRASDVGACHRRERLFILATPADASRQLHDWTRAARQSGGAEPSDSGVGDVEAVALLPTPKASDGTNGGPNMRDSSGNWMLPAIATKPEVWGEFTPAIERHGQVFGRPAAYPTVTSPRGSQVLSPLLVEWMMGLPEGHVTGVDGLSRNAQLKLLGNGVVPLQAEYAIRQLLPHVLSQETTVTDTSPPPCPFCHRDTPVTKAGEYRVHGPRAERCEGSGTTPVHGVAAVPVEHQYLGTMQRAIEQAPAHTGNGRTAGAEGESTVTVERISRPAPEPPVSVNRQISDTQSVTMHGECNAVELPTEPLEVAPPTPDITAERIHEAQERAKAAAVAIARRRAPVTPAWTGAQRLDSLGADAIMGRKECAQALLELLRAGRTRLACDLESEGKTGIAARSLKAIIFSPCPEGDVAVVLDPRDPVQAKLATFVFDHATELVFHNAPFDVPNLAMNGLFGPQHAHKVTDTLIWARGAEPDNLVSKALGDCGKRYLSLATDKGVKQAMQAAGMRSTEQYYREMDLDRPFYARGAASDAIVTARLRDVVRKAYLDRLTVGHPFADWGVTGDEAQRLVEREQRLNRMSLRRTCRGYEVDLGYLDEFNEKHAASIDMAAGKLTEFGVRPTNAQDLLKVLDAQGQVPQDYPRTEKTGLLSGSKDHLPMLDSPLARLFLWHKEQTHVLKDYLEKVRDLAIERDGRMLIFPTINYFAAVTGRQSIGNPPLHQFPEAARGVLLGNWSSIDWSQIEPVTIANIAGQEDVLYGYEHEGKKFYTVVEEAAGVTYKQAKTQLLGTLYGQGLSLTAAKLGVDVERAREIKDAVFAPMPKVYQLTQTLREIAKQYRLVPTVSGRILPIPMGRWKGEWSVATHKGVNFHCQGSAYDVLAESALSVEDAGLGDHLHLMMHDEMVVETEAAPEIRRLMEVPPARLVRQSGRTPILHTDMTDLGDRWNVA